MNARGTHPPGTNRSAFLGSLHATAAKPADRLIARATAYSLPAFKTPEKLHAVQTLLTAFTGSEDTQQETNRDKELCRLDHDTILDIINTRRAAIQHAADVL